MPLKKKEANKSHKTRKVHVDNSKKHARSKDKQENLNHQFGHKENYSAEEIATKNHLGSHHGNKKKHTKHHERHEHLAHPIAQVHPKPLLKSSSSINIDEIIDGHWT